MEKIIKQNLILNKTVNITKLNIDNSITQLISKIEWPGSNKHSSLLLQCKNYNNKKVLWHRILVKCSALYFQLVPAFVNLQQVEASVIEKFTNLLLGLEF
jgi:hypothetical protein